MYVGLGGWKCTTVSLNEGGNEMKYYFLDNRCVCIVSSHAGHWFIWHQWVMEAGLLVNLEDTSSSIHQRGLIFWREMVDDNHFWGRGFGNKTFVSIKRLTVLVDQSLILIFFRRSETYSKLIIAVNVKRFCRTYVCIPTYLHSASFLHNVSICSLDALAPPKGPECFFRYRLLKNYQ